jgi:arabinofuranosyltransferase
MSRSDEIAVPQSGRGTRAFGLPGTLAQRWNALAVTACGATVLVLGHRHRWTNDDALIYTRAVRQILAGNGPVYNVGERAETSTGTLWQWLLAAGSALPGVDDPLRLAVVLGLLLTVAGFVLALDGARRMIRVNRPSGALLPVGVLLLLPLCATWDYATSGLETGLTFGYLGGSWWLLVRARACLCRETARPHSTLAGRDLPGLTLPARALTSQAPPGQAPSGHDVRGPGAGGRDPYGQGLTRTAFVFGLGPLVRPDLALVSGVFLVALLLLWQPTLRTALRWAGAAAGLPVAYEVFRAGYYGVLVPLPALAKEASGTQWQFGWDYLLNTVGPYRLWVPLALVAVFAVGAGVRRMLLGDRSGLWRDTPESAQERGADVVLKSAPVLAGLLSAFFVVKIGGDFMHGRMVLPALFLVLLPVFLLPCTRAVAVLAVAVGIWGAACFALWRPPLDSPDERIVYDSHSVYVHSLGQHPVTQAAHTERPRFFTHAVRSTERAGLHGLVLRLPRDAGYPVVPLAPHVNAPIAGAEARLGNAGAVLPLNGWAVDLLGLANPLGAHTLPTKARKAGHEKPLDRAWVLADLTAPGAPVPYGVDPRRVAAARHALACGPLPELRASTRAPLTPARFLANLTGAWERTHLRIPADPLAAERAVCGTRGGTDSGTKHGPASGTKK